MVSGVQQALDLLTRLLLKQGEPVWIEDPGYFEATIAFANACAQMIPVPLDGQGLWVSAGLKACRRAKGVYVTPGTSSRWGNNIARATAWPFSSGPLAPGH